MDYTFYFNFQIIFSKYQ